MTATTAEPAQHNAGRSDLKLMVIGSYPPPLGGTTVSLQSLTDHLQTRVARVIVVDTNSARHSRMLGLLHAVHAVWRNRNHVDVVSVHFSDRATLMAGPPFWMLCRLLGKPIVFRQFGGHFMQTLAALPGISRRFVEATILKSDAVLLQTRAMVDAARLRTRSPVHWFPTARAQKPHRYAASYAHGARNNLACLYVGHVSRDKGVLLAANAVAQVPQAELHVYGPLVDITERELTEAGASYHGVLAQEAVTQVMRDHDLLVFPSMLLSEGYPGTLVEAVQTGLPIVATDMPQLREMLDGGEASFVPMSDCGAFTDAIQALADHPQSLIQQSESLLRCAHSFSADVVFTRFIDICCSLRRDTARN